MSPRGDERGLYGIDWRRPATWLWLVGSAVVLAATAGLAPNVAALVIERNPDHFPSKQAIWAIAGLAVPIFLVLLFGASIATLKIAGIGLSIRVDATRGGRMYWYCAWLLISMVLGGVIAYGGKAHFGIAQPPVSWAAFNMVACFWFWPYLVRILSGRMDCSRSAAES